MDNIKSKIVEQTPNQAMCGFKGRWDASDVIAEFDSNWNITLGELARMSQWSVGELKKLLMGK